MRKSWSHGLLLLAAVFLAAGCDKEAATNETPSGPKHVIAVIPKLTNTVYWQSVLAGAKEAGKDFGYEIIWDGPDRETNSARQIQIVEEAIARKVEGVVIAPVDRQNLVPSVDKLAELNIPCVIIDSGLDAVHFVSFASTDNYQGGVLAAQRMGHALGGKGNILVVRHIVGSHAAVKRVSGFVDTISNDFPGIKIVESESGQDTAEIAQKVTAEMLQRHGDVQGLFACNVDMSVGALRALQEAKRTDVKMVAFDPDQSLIEGLRSGQVVAIIVQDPYRMGYEGVKALALKNKGQSSPRLINTGVEVVTSDNLTDPRIMRLLGEQQ
ncbi:MAG TPA: substrate-binding domain-containing protein [Candidatus Acidoferrales bacterium]|nr:substrate-binding domain-containing protein [Candidatus Acidoferrales bacterium]